MRAYKGPKINPESDGLAWLRVPMERVLDAILPAEEDVRELARVVDGYFSEYGTQSQQEACQRVLDKTGANLEDLYA